MVNSRPNFDGVFPHPVADRVVIRFLEWLVADGTWKVS